MNPGKISVLMKISILLIALAGVAICAFWYPFSISLTAVGLPSGERVPPTNAENIAFWTQLIFYWAASVPCFAVLLLAWSISNDVKRDEVFSVVTARKLNLAFCILLIDSCAFLVGNIVFTILQWNVFAVVYYLAGALGIALSFCVYAIKKIVDKARTLKEENDSIL